MTAGSALAGGFADQAIDSARAFRVALEAMARPGTIREAAFAEPPAPLSRAAGSLVLMLCDPETPLHLAGECDCEPVRDWIAFHAGAPMTKRQDAAFALGAWEDLLPLADYPAGSHEYPDRSATLIAELPVLKPEGIRLKGPGIEREARLSLPDAAALAANAALYPLGLDFYFTAGDKLAGLPRSVKPSSP